MVYKEKKKTFSRSDQIWGTLRVDQFTSFFLDNSVGKVKATLVSKKKILKVKSEELRSLLGYCNEKKYCRNYLVNLRNITSLDNLRPFKDFSVSVF